MKFKRKFIELDINPILTEVEKLIDELEYDSNERSVVDYYHLKAKLQELKVSNLREMKK